MDTSCVIALTLQWCQTAVTSHNCHSAANYHQGTTVTPPSHSCCIVLVVHSKWFEPRSISSSCSVIVRVSVVLKRTVGDNFSRFSACRSSLVKLLSGKEADCKVEAILLLMLSLTGSDRSLWRDRTASTLDTIVSVGIRLGVTECFSP